MKQALFFILSLTVAASASASILCNEIGDGIEARFCEQLPKVTSSRSCEDAAKKAVVLYNKSSIGDSLRGPVRIESVQAIQEDAVYQVTYLDPTEKFELYAPIQKNIFVSTGTNRCWAVGIETK